MEGTFEGINLADRPLPTTLPDDHNIGDGLAIMTWVMLAISTVLIAARMVSKIMILKRFRIDDVFLLLSWVSTIHFLRFINHDMLTLSQIGAVVYSAMMQLAYHEGFGRHSRKQHILIKPLQVALTQN
jgi:hypothetical protein